MTNNGGKNLQILEGAPIWSLKTTTNIHGLNMHYHGLDSNFQPSKIFLHKSKKDLN